MSNKREIVVKDRNGSDVTMGSIVEIVPWSSDNYEGLWFVVGFEVRERGVYVMLAKSRLKKWELMVMPARVSLRCYKPEKAKGE